MAVIDKNMYEKLKKWCDFDKTIRPKNQKVMYVNSRDSALTSTTIRKLMFEMHQEDVHGELYMSYYSAQNFYRNMRDYYAGIAELYRIYPQENDTTVDIIKRLPPTCGWIVLVVKDIDYFSDDSEKMQEMIETLRKFAAKSPSIILIGNGDYKDVFSKCEYALHSMEAGLTAKEEDNIVMIGSYEQEANPCYESVVFDKTEKQCAELSFYWDTIYSQLEEGYFDYADFKPLFKDTMEYIVPRVAKEKVYRKDLFLIEGIGNLEGKTYEELDGCTPWEFEASKKMAAGLHDAIVNLYGHNDDFTGEKIGIEMWIKERSEEHCGVYFSGQFSLTRMICTENVCHNIDKAATCIRMSTYEGNDFEAWEYMQDEDEEDG